MEKQEQDEAQAGDIEYAQAQQTVLRRRLNDLKERLRDAERRWDKQISGLGVSIAKTLDLLDDEDSDNEEEKPEPM